MIYRFLANIVVGLHLAFIIFAVAGGLLVWKWRRCAWLHIPAFLWAVLIELKNWTCPLTPLENWLRYRGGEVGYEVGFIEHYLLPIIYPLALTREVQIILGLLLFALNLAVYAWLLKRSFKQ